MRHEIEFTINKNSKNLQEESFVIPLDLAEICLDIKLPDACRYMAYVIVTDEKGQIRLQKLLGYGEQLLGIGIDGWKTSIGGVPGIVHAGNWKLTLGIFTEYAAQRLGDTEVTFPVVITDKSQEITEPVGAKVWTDGETGLTILPEKYDWNQSYPTKKEWYKGDFHTHTRLSDGKETVANAMVKAKKMDMDFYVPTEHNLMHTGWCDTELCIVPGIEITTDKGHFNVFGITDMPNYLPEILRTNGTDKVDEYVEKTMAEAKEKNWIVSINHPFLTIWKWRYKKLRLMTFPVWKLSMIRPTQMDLLLTIKHLRLSMHYGKTDIRFMA